MDASHINKTMDRTDLERPDCQAILQELFALMRRMQSRGAAYSSWYGGLGDWPGIWDIVNRGAHYRPWPGNPDELRIPWFLLWEIAWIVANSPMRRGARVLDMGGAGSLFSCFLANRGLDVVAIDLDRGLCDRANETAKRMNWRLTAHCMDMTALSFDDECFDHVFSVCVFEHLPISGRIACNAHVARVLRPGGTAAYTFDYGNPQSFGRLDSADDVRRQFVEPSGLRVRGEADFVDTGRRYLEAPQCFGFGRFTRLAARLHAGLRGSVGLRRALSGSCSYTIGAQFLEKPP
jgi:SAM-dependent methyltransferase